MRSFTLIVTLLMVACGSETRFEPTDLPQDLPRAGSPTPSPVAGSPAPIPTAGQKAPPIHTGGLGGISGTAGSPAPNVPVGGTVAPSMPQAGSGGTGLALNGLPACGASQECANGCCIVWRPGFQSCDFADTYPDTPCGLADSFTIKPYSLVAIKDTTITAHVIKSWVDTFELDNGLAFHFAGGRNRLLTPGMLVILTTWGKVESTQWADWDAVWDGGTELTSVVQISAEGVVTATCKSNELVQFPDGSVWQVTSGFGFTAYTGPAVVWAWSPELTNLQMGDTSCMVRKVL